MKRFLLLLAPVILITAVLLRQPALAPAGETQGGKAVTLNGQKFFLEVADEPAEWEKGLSNRQQLKPRGGMLFEFDQPGRPCFWMKDTLIALDMLWFDSKYNLVHVQQNVVPSSYPQNFCPNQDAQYVVELKGGTAAEFNLKPGIVLTFK